MPAKLIGIWMGSIWPIAAAILLCMSLVASTSMIALTLDFNFLLQWLPRIHNQEMATGYTCFETQCKAGMSGVSVELCCGMDALNGEVEKEHYLAHSSGPSLKGWPKPEATDTRVPRSKTALEVKLPNRAACPPPVQAGHCADR